MSHLLLASDRNFYVVKFQDNPQGHQILINEWIATHIGRALGFTIPPCTTIDVSLPFMRENDLVRVMPSRDGTVPQPRAGKQFASSFVGGLYPGKLVQVLPDSILINVKNIDEFTGMLLFDMWGRNGDARQAVFTKPYSEDTFTANFIDHGFFFGGRSWTTSETYLRGIYGADVVYKRVVGWESFEPWLTRIASLSERKLRSIAASVPDEWQDSRGPAIDGVISNLINRQGQIVSLLNDLRSRKPELFPNWNQRARSYRGFVKLAPVDCEQADIEREVAPQHATIV